jgi:hypothetical protein
VCFTLPFSSVIARSAWEDTQGNCVTRIVVLPRSMSLQKQSFHRAAAVLVSKAEKISSSSNTGALEYNALARATRDFCPPIEPF